MRAGSGRSWQRSPRVAWSSRPGGQGGAGGYGDPRECAPAAGDPAGPARRRTAAAQPATTTCNAPCGPGRAGATGTPARSSAPAAVDLAAADAALEPLRSPTRADNHGCPAGAGRGGRRPRHPHHPGARGRAGRRRSGPPARRAHRPGRPGWGSAKVSSKPPWDDLGSRAVGRPRSCDCSPLPRPAAGDPGRPGALAHRLDPRMAHDPCSDGHRALPRSRYRGGPGGAPAPGSARHGRGTPERCGPSGRSDP